jgi:hypothetical protein
MWLWRQHDNGAAVVVPNVLFVGVVADVVIDVVVASVDVFVIFTIVAIAVLLMVFGVGGGVAMVIGVGVGAGLPGSAISTLLTNEASIS